MAMLAVLLSEPGFYQLCTAQAQCDIPNNFSTPTVRITSFAYDVEGNLTQVNSPEGVINYGYDMATGRIVHVCTRNSEMEYTYDADGRLQTVQVLKRNGTAVNETTTYRYDQVGNRSELDLPNGVVTTYKYDDLNRLTNMVHQFGVTNLATYSYMLGATGRRTNAVEVLRQENNAYQTNVLTWQFDPMYRLTNETCISVTGGAPYAYTNAYVYDPAGNRMQMVRTGSGADTNSYAYDANDELLTEASWVNGTNSYSYDENGSLTNKASAAGPVGYTYDLANKLNGVFEGGSQQVAYYYNDDGIRVQSIGSGTTNNFLIDANNQTGYSQVLEELPGLGATPTRSYVVGDDVLAQCNGSSPTAPSYFLQDGHGNNRQLMQLNGFVTSHYNYEAYGSIQSSISSSGESGAATTKLFCGEQYDSTLQMYNLRARYYDPGTGRFNQRDAFSGDDEDPQSLHRYLYCYGDPLNVKDPSGRFGVMDVMAAISVLAVLSSAIDLVVHPSLKSFGMLALNVVTLPIAWTKAITILGRTSQYLVDLFDAAAAASEASEIAAKAWLITQGITNVFKGETFLKSFGLAGEGGKAVDWIAENAENGNWILVEAKSVLGPVEITRCIGDIVGTLTSGVGKFSSTLAALAKVDQMAGLAVRGLDRMVITCREIATDKLGDYSVDEKTGELLYKDVKVTIQGIPVVVKQIGSFF